MAFFVLTVFILVKKPVLAQPEPVESFPPGSLISSNYELKQKLARGIENSFLILLRRDCSHSDKFVKTLSFSIGSIPEGKLLVFYCGWDGFCHELLHASKYPDLRFYTSTGNLSRYATYLGDTTLVSEHEQVKRFIDLHINPVLPPISIKDTTDDWINKLSNELFRVKEGVALYCSEDIDDKFIKSLLQGLDHLWALPLLDCSKEIVSSNRLLSKFLRKRRISKSIKLGVARFWLDELSIFDQKLADETLLPFLSSHVKPLTMPFTSDVSYTSVVHNKTVVLLFESSEEDRKTLRKAARQPKMNEEFIFAYCDSLALVTHIGVGEYYGCTHLKRLTGVAEEDLPAVRLVRLSEKGPVTKFMFPESEIHLWKLLEFLRDFSRGGVLPYSKNQLPLRTESAREWRNAATPVPSPTFIFVYGDGQLCPSCNAKKREFIDFIETTENILAEAEHKFALYEADILRNELDEHVAAALPMLLAFNAGETDFSKARALLYSIEAFSRLLEGLTKPKRPLITEEL